MQNVLEMETDEKKYRILRKCTLLKLQKKRMRKRL